MSGTWTALGLLVVGALLAALLARPVREWARVLRAGERVRIEDALKHLWNSEYRDTPATLQSLSGALGLSGNRVASLVTRLQRLELIEERHGTYGLTAEGRRDALRVIRIHRLWERYLSDETGLDAREWHRHAEAREHRTTHEEAEALAAKMGWPRFDPHGDPIPTASGEVPDARGKPLTGLEVGQTGEIVHVEDEPQAVYEQLLAASLFPGMRVHVLEAGPRRIRIEADGDEQVLAPVVAANVTVVRRTAEEDDAGPGVERLSSLVPGQSGRVTGISTACRGAGRRRLLDLGIVPGTVVSAERTSPGGDPTAYRIRGAVIALRREQAERVLIDREEKSA